MSCPEVRRQLERYGILLLQDKKLPSVATIIAGEPMSKSWWSHPRAQEMFRCLETIEEEALATRLINGKVTYVHKRLWPALVAIGMANAKLWDNARPASAKEVQQRLLAVAEEVHTESGRHEMRVEPWKSWAARKGVKPLASVTVARAEIETAAESIGAPLSALPWHR